MNTIEAIQLIREQLSPSLKYLGVVPTFVPQRGALRTREQKALQYIEEELSMPKRLKSFGAPIRVFENERIYRREAIAKVAGEEIPFFTDAEVRDMYTALGQSIVETIGPELTAKVKNGNQKPPTRYGENVVSIAG